MSCEEMRQDKPKLDGEHTCGMDWWMCIIVIFTGLGPLESSLIQKHVRKRTPFSTVNLLANELAQICALFEHLRLCSWIAEDALIVKLLSYRHRALRGHPQLAA